MGENIKHAHFVLKKLNNRQQTIDAFKKYQILKNANLHTWTTFRIDNNEDVILMTDGNKDDKSLLTCNQNTSAFAMELAVNKIMEIENFSSFLDSIFAEALNAQRQNIYIHQDVYGFLIDKDTPNNKGKTSIEYILADTDNVFEEKDLPTGAVFDNVGQLYMALSRFLEKYVDSGKMSVYMQEINRRRNFQEL